MKKHILLIEDEAPIRQMVKFALEREGYEISEAANAKEARTLIAERVPDLMLVDWMLPDLSGPELIKRLRAEELTHDVPAIMLTAKADEENMIQGLDHGADDYLTKPVSMKVLSARIKALLRRSIGFNEETVLRIGRLALDQASYQLRIDQMPVAIGLTEFRLLEFFMQHPGRVYSRAQLLDFVWGQSKYLEERTVDVHILRLRKALKPYEVDHYIQTVRGAGYRFEQDNT
ncbi:MAG: phosphate regulon transcriptional regulator PhoB [Thiofilum sp.]|nr:phosphate regulon transcriptional regulator PhoB [Thiofilum sp.]MBK8453634.1 phosphate regulon transcriptional regulator PhoB [Thiofilum sp.]